MQKFKKLLLFLGIATIFLTPLNVSAIEILFAHVDSDGNYFDDGNRIRNMLVGTGYNVTTRILDQAVYTDFNTFDQIFVYDLYTGTDNTAIQTANYQGIAHWYNGRTDKNLILDGRIISSDIAWVNPAETAWIQNYRDQLNLRGGGLVLGTDHATAFTEGINQINNYINIDPFTGFYYTQPLRAYVDPLSPLWIPTLTQGGTINDNSSTSFVPTGLQANGQTLTPVAYHGTVSQAWELAAVSSTMGSVTFGTAVPEPSTMILFSIGLLGGLAGARRKLKK